MAATERQRLAFRDKFRSLYREDFQSWFEELARALHPSGDFVAIRNTRGDGGLDGYVISSRLVYQVYAPVMMTDSETAKKIRTDFRKAYDTLGGHLKAWHFIHNHPEAKIGFLTAAAINELKQQHPGIEFQILDIDSLWRQVSALPEEVVEDLVTRVSGSTANAAGANRSIWSWPSAPSRNRMALFSAFLLMVALLIGALWGVKRATEKLKPRFSAETLKLSKVPLPRPSVAVLTFENRFHLKDLDWLATALPEAIGAQLGIENAVRVADRHEVVLAETDLLISNPTKEIQARDLASLRDLLGVELLVSGAYQSVGNAGARLDLVLYDTRSGRRVAEASQEGTMAAWLGLAKPEPLLRTIENASSKPGPKMDLQALFPSSPAAAKLYFQGLAKYRRFDIEGARALFAEAVEQEPHPLVLAALAKAYFSLGWFEEAVEAIGRAMELDRKAQGRPFMLSPRYRAELQVVEQRVAGDPETAAESTENFFRHYFPDDARYGLAAVQAYVDAGLYEKALTLLQEIRSLPGAAKDPRIDYSEAKILSDGEQYRQARASAMEALTKATILRALRLEALSHLLLATMASSTGQALQAEKLYRQAREGFDRTGDKWNSVQALEGLALSYVNHDLQTAERLYRTVVREYEILGDEQEQARALFGLSAVLTLRGSPSDAERLSEKASAMAGESSCSLQGLAEFQIGTPLHFAGRLSEARERYEVARDLLRTADPRLYALTLTNLGEIEHMRGRFADAKARFQEASNLYIVAKNLPGEAYGDVLLGRVAGATGNSSEARDRFKRAVTKLDSASQGSSPESESLVEALLASAELELLSGRPDKAREMADRAKNIAEGVGLEPGHSRARALQARALLEQGFKKEAQHAATEAVWLARGDFRAVREAKMAEARVRAAFGEVNRALRDLKQISEETAQSGQLIYQLESLLALGTIEMEDGRLHEGRSRLEALRIRAGEIGFDQMAKRVATALGESSSR